ncbi:MAG: hypothetical protein WBS24_07440 [Terriglobales bacterium]
MPRHYLLILCIFALAALAAAQTPAGVNNLASATPLVHGSLDGTRTAIFTTPRDACGPNDVPDAMARAFRDYKGTVHFSSASSVLYQSLGSTLESVQHSCDAAFSSANDTNPADFNDQVWLDSFYTFDGKTIAALGHTEYHGWAIAGECHVKGNNQYGACEYDSDTYHQSKDGGYHFSTPKVPGNFLAGIPYKYEIDRGPAGYSVDTNIIELSGWYYAVTTSWTWPPNCSGQTGPHHCITTGGAPIRTQNVFDPASWLGWNGSAFAVSFVDPYPGPVSHPGQHVFTPVQYMGFVNAINLYQVSATQVVVATLWDYWDNELGPPGMYLTTSTDMVNWTKPTLVVKLKDLLAEDPPGNWLYAYFSLIDPSATDLNFSVLGNHPSLYYVRLNNNNSSERVLFRRPITLTPAD